jgi:hypothetical protein
MTNNPYAPPKADVVGDHSYGKDGADLYIESLPSPFLRLALGTWVAAGVLSLFLGFRMLISLEQTATAVALELVHVVAGVGAFGVTYFLRRGQAWAALAGGVVAALLVGESFFALATGSIGGLVQMGLTVLAGILTVVSMKELTKIGRARAAMARMGLARP